MARLSLIDGTSGSVIAIASWVCLHAMSARDILSVWAEQISQPGVDETTRIGLLHMLHEVILCCQQRSVNDAGVRSLLRAIAEFCPNAFGAIAGAKGGTEDVRFKLAQVLQWWTVLRVFPPALLQEYKKVSFGEVDPQTIIAAHQAGVQGNGAGGSAQSVPQELQGFVKLYSKYTSAKDRRQAALQSNQGEAITELTEDLTRRLINVIKHLDGSDDRGGTVGGMPAAGSLLGRLKEELAQLQGGSQVTSPTTAATGAETTTAAPQAATLDPLADLFD